MKILKIFGVVVGIHVFALVLIFANPGCSSPNKAAPSPTDTVGQVEEPAAAPARAPSDGSTPVTIAGGDTTVMPAPAVFDPNAAAIPAIRFSPTRPGTPVANSLESPPVSDVTPATTYTVGKGDSLWTIAKKHHISIAEIAAANNVKSTVPVRVGQKLIIPGKSISSHASAPEPVAKAAPGTVAPTPRTPGESVKHVVKSGETLGAIARKYQVKMGEIATANNIADPAKIRPGMELIIPGWQAPGAKSAKTNSTRAAAATTTTSPAPATPPPADVPDTTPTILIPAPESTSSAPASAEPPVIHVDEKR